MNDFVEGKMSVRRRQRSRRYLPPESICYLCGQVIGPADDSNSDHVPPERFFAKDILRRFSPTFDLLATHVECNSSYKPDEEYFTMCFAGQAGTPTARAVFDDIRRAVRAGHDVGLLKTVLGQFSKVRLSDGSRLFTYDQDRAGRVVWKIARGLYFLEVERFLPEWKPKTLALRDWADNERSADRYPWCRAVVATASMGRHQAVIDYKWLGRSDGDARLNAMAILLWDRLVFLAAFHDALCHCDECAEAEIKARVTGVERAG